MEAAPALGKRIIVFTPFYPPHMGGLQNHAEEFNRHLLPFGYQITVVTSQLPVSTPLYSTQDGLTIIRLPSWEIIPNYPVPKIWARFFWQYVRHITASPYDIVLSRTRFFLGSLAALLLAKLTKIPLVHVEHGSDHVQLRHRGYATLAKWYDLTLGKMVLRHANYVVANSNATARFVHRLAPKRPIQTIYRGVEGEKILSVAKAQDIPTVMENQVVIAYAGRLISGKGVADLLNVLAVCQRLPVLGLVIGDGADRIYLEQLCDALHLERRVLFLGQQSHERSLSLIKASDIFINPSYTEGLPSAVIEAALLKKAIISTNVGGTPEIFTHGHSGFLVPPGNIAELTDYVTQLIRNRSLRAQLGENAYREVKEKFLWKKSIMKYHDLFELLTTS